MSISPDFFIAGAPKAGTTSLYHDLRRHPDVCMSDPKETWYFYDYRKYEKSLGWYTSRYFGHCDEKDIVGEATPGYMAHPDSPRRIAECLGKKDLQFFFLLRDPIERVLSHYYYDVQRGVRNPSRSFSETIRDPEEQSVDPSRNHVGLLEMGRYVRHLKRYEKYFGQNQIHPIFFRDYINDRTKTLGRIFDILGLTFDAEIQKLIQKGAHQNSTRYPVNPTLFAIMKRAWAVAGRMLGPLTKVLTPVRDTIRQNLLSESGEGVAVVDADRSFLRDFYAQPNSMLAGYLDCSIEHWN